MLRTHAGKHAGPQTPIYLQSIHIYVLYQANETVITESHAMMKACIGDYLNRSQMLIFITTYIHTFNVTNVVKVQMVW